MPNQGAIRLFLRLQTPHLPLEQDYSIIKIKDFIALLIPKSMRP